MFAKHIRSISNKTFGYYVATRGIQEKANLAVNNDFTPVQIDVPWGKIEGKLWENNNKGKQPVLALHGWLDNAGSFDMLAPLLKKSSILAIDLPGHGHSSWLPRGIPYTDEMGMLTVKMIIKHFGWDKVKLLGHSMGGVLSYNYAHVFPNEIQFVVSIDSLSFIPKTLMKYIKQQNRAINNFVDFERKYYSEAPSYSEEKAIEKWMNATVFKSLDVPATKTLMIRGSKRKEDGTYYYTRDYRLTFDGFSNLHTISEIKEICEFISCPYMVVKATNSPHASNKMYWTEITEIMKKYCKEFRIATVEGTHHLHMMNAEQVANEINPFLEKYDL